MAKPTVIPICPVCLMPVRAGDPAARQAGTGALTHLGCKRSDGRPPAPGEPSPIDGVDSRFGPMS